jgi:hypothetical protein
VPREPDRTIGWREWVALPDLGVRRIKAKIDTGARSSALHAFDIEMLPEGRQTVRFTIHPLQRNIVRTVVAEAPLIDERLVRNSGGKEELRPVVETTVELMGQRWPIEITLTRRDVMGFRMLLGRQAIRRGWLVNPGRSYFGGRPVRATTRPSARASTASGSRSKGRGP